MYNVDIIQKCIKIVLNLNLLFIIIHRVCRRGIKWQSNEVFWLGISEKDCFYMSDRPQEKQISGRGNSYPHRLLMWVHRWTPLAVNCGDKFADCTSCITVNQGATLFAECLENSSPWRLSKKWVVNFQLLIWWWATSPLPRCGWRAIHGALWVTPGCQSPTAPQAFTPAEKSEKLLLLLTLRHIRWVSSSVLLTLCRCTFYRSFLYIVIMQGLTVLSATKDPELLFIPLYI